MKTVPLFELCDATVLRGDHKALDAIDLCLPQGQNTVILGPNGCGKSTLIRLLHRNLHPLYPQPGAPPPIRVLGERLWNLFDLRTQLGLVSSDLERELLATADIAVHTAVVASFFGSLYWARDAAITTEQQQQANLMLEQVGLAGMAERSLESLSLGELRRVVLARALVHQPHTLLLDEPTTGLDPGARQRLLELLTRLASQGVTLLLVTHHLEEVLPCFERAVLLKAGRIVADGPTAVLLTPDRLAALYDTPVWTPGLARFQGVMPL